jgi:alkanesulfonate monooxygenase SsuD/methylene tetrahydromethanopterin reductase-like flavin-dependent oxidoreductase (luciferase family)
MAKLAVMIEGQEGVDWRLWKHLAETVEGLGFDSFWRSDHLLSVMGANDRAVIECWTSLALIATWTKRIQFGPNVTPMTFRFPGVLAKQAAAVDILSGGRLVLGIGAGWFQEEHAAFGIPFPSLKERMDRMDAGIEEMKAIWATYKPGPMRGWIPLLIGGGGEEELLRRADGLRRVIPSYFSRSPEEVLATVRQKYFGGTPEEIAEQMRPYIKLGVDLFWMQHFLFEDDEAMQLLMDEVAPLIT